MHPVEGGEISHTLFHSIKDTLTSSPLLDVLILAAFSLAGNWVVANKDFLKERYPILYSCIIVLFVLIICFVLYMIAAD